MIDRRHMTTGSNNLFLFGHDVCILLHWLTFVFTNINKMEMLIDAITSRNHNLAIVYVKFLFLAPFINVPMYLVRVQAKI